jgi:hypothetical protein
LVRRTTSALIPAAPRALCGHSSSLKDLIEQARRARKFDE